MKPNKRRTQEEYDGKTPLDHPEQELFCILYTTNTLPVFWGNGQNSYAFAYGYDKKIDDIKALLNGPAKNRKGKSKIFLSDQIQKHHNTCRVSAVRLLTNVNAKRRCGYLLDQLGTNLIVDRELVYVMQQREDLDVKMRAIEHHDKREQRIREKVDIKHAFEPIEGINYVVPTPTKK